jgi:hypothetical protein
MRGLLAALALVLTFAPLGVAQGTFTPVDYPGAIWTTAVGINTIGEVVGNYTFDGLNVHGFLLSDGTYTTIDYPGGFGSSLSGLNDEGQIVGVANSQPAFVYDRTTHVFTPLPSIKDGFVEPSGINNSGTIVGDFGVQRQNESGSAGFEFIDGTYVVVLPVGYYFSYLGGINNDGVAVGLANTNTTYEIFLYGRNKLGKYIFEKLPIPARIAAVSGINDSSAISGSLIPSDGVSTGFVYQDGRYILVSYPGSVYTAFIGINDSGVVAGYYLSANLAHGFIWTPPAPQKGH